MIPDCFNLETRVLRTIQKYGMLAEGDKVLVAVSGGADSMALLTLLLTLRGQLCVTIEAAHYEHGIRQGASLEDARFVQAFCLSRDVPCHMGHGDVPVLSNQWKCSLEDAARRARYAFFDETIRQTGATRLALAHQQEDQAETVLLHLVHGCGLDGLAGMRPVRGNRIRPLLFEPRAALEGYLLDQVIPWREDETNHDLSYARNLLRHEVFPVLRRLNPRVHEAMGRTALQAAIVSDRQTERAEESLGDRIKRMPYGAFWALEGERPAAEAVRGFARWAGVPELDARQTEALVDAEPGMYVNLPGDWRGLRTRSRYHLLCAKETPWAFAPEDFVWEDAEAVAGYGDGVHVQVFDAESVEGAEFRTRREGDLFAPLGRNGTQKLKQTLRDAGVDRPFRDFLPVLAKGNRILWIVGVKPGRDAAVTPSTKRTVRIRYLGELPWEIHHGNGECKTC